MERLFYFMMKYNKIKLYRSFLGTGEPSHLATQIARDQRVPSLVVPQIIALCY